MTIDEAEHIDATELRAITDLQTLIDFLNDRWKGGEEHLDMMVHEAKATEASGINNAGFERQVNYLIGEDWWETEDLAQHLANELYGDGVGDEPSD